MFWQDLLLQVHSHLTIIALKNIIALKSDTILADCLIDFAVCVEHLALLHLVNRSKHKLDLIILYISFRN